MARVLLIDDDASLRDILSLSLEDAGFTVDIASDGREGLRKALEATADLVISDVNMPHIDGFSLCRQLRERGVRTPLILLTSRDTEIDEALGLELGADDFMSKPFSTRVLLARIQALLRREQLRADEEAGGEVLTVGELVLDPERIEVRYRGQQVEVTVTEYRLLDALARRPGVVFSRQRLMDLIRGDDSIVVERIIDTYVRRLRRKLEEISTEFDRIETIVGAGYRWRDER